MKYLIEKVTADFRFKGSERESHMVLWGKYSKQKEQQVQVPEVRDAWHVE